MLDRFAELEEPIRTTTVLLNDIQFPIPSVKEWKFLREILTILKLMESITNMMSGEKYITASTVIILTDRLNNVYSNFIQEFSKLALTVAESILNEIKTGLENLELSNSLILTTFLDPRFKNLGFSKEIIADRVKKL